MLAGVIHHHHHAAHACHKVHRPAHALYQLARNHPVRQIAVFRHLHRAEDRHSNLAATDHRE